MLEAVGAYVAAALTLFLIVNVIGRHSITRGYRSLDLLQHTDEAPALNGAIRVVTPTAFVVVMAALAYEIGFSHLVSKIYWIAILYVVFRWGFNLGWDRRMLLNWPKELVLAVLIIGVNIGVTNQMLANRSSLLPERGELINEMWILLGLYLFYTLNQIRIGEDRTIQRKHRYIAYSAHRFLTRFGGLIAERTQNEKVKALILGIMVFENFNRPKPARILERFAGHIGRPGTFGLMQISSQRPLNDRDSVAAGVDRVVAAWERERGKLYEYNPDLHVAEAMLKDYNADDDYISAVIELAHIIEFRFYRGTRDTLSLYPEGAAALG
jgi:hypothetical protein